MFHQPAIVFHTLCIYYVPLNSTQVDTFHASFQVLLKTFLVPDFLLDFSEIELNWTMTCVIVLVVGGALNQLLI